MVSLLHLPQELLDRVADEFDLGAIREARPLCSALNALASSKVQAVKVPLGGAAPAAASVWRAFGNATRLVVDLGLLQRDGLAELISSAPQRITSISVQGSYTCTMLSDGDSAALAAALRTRKLLQLDCGPVEVAQAAADDILASQDQLQQLSLACRLPGDCDCDTLWEDPVWRPSPAAAATLQSLSLSCIVAAVDITGLVVATDTGPASSKWQSLQRLSISAGRLDGSSSLAQLSCSITSLSLDCDSMAGSDLQHLRRLPHLAELSLYAVEQQDWRALGQLAQLHKLTARFVAPDASVQLPALEHLVCDELYLPPGASPGSLAAALPALKVLDVCESRRFSAAIQALQGHPLLAKISMNTERHFYADPAGAWLEWGLSTLPELKEFSAYKPAAWLGPLLEDLAGCAALEEAYVHCSEQQWKARCTPAPLAATLQGMAAKVAAGGMARLASLTLSIPGAEQRYSVAEVLPLVEALARRAAGGTAAGAAGDVYLDLPVSLEATRADALQQLLQARGLLLVDSEAGVQGLLSFSASAPCPSGPTVHVYPCTFIHAVSESSSEYDADLPLQ
jgi:hypothetical protein